MSITIHKPCPSCQSNNSVEIRQQTLSCNTASCRFSKSYTCPICDHSLQNSDFKNDEHGEFFRCSSCKTTLHTRRIANIIENSLRVSKETLCEFCNTPTLHPHQSSTGHRCLFFPKCSGQANLFGTKTEELVFLDFETSGLEMGKDFITEIGALKLDKEGFEHSFQSLIKIPVPLSQKIIDITGITDEMLETAPALEEVLDSFLDFLGNAKIVAHNAKFDIPWLMITLLQHQKPLIHNTIICTLEWAKASDEKKCSLGVLTKKYNIQHQNAHRALADAKATKEIFFILESKKIAKRPYQEAKPFHLTSERILKQYKTFETS